MTKGRYGSNKTKPSTDWGVLRRATLKLPFRRARRMTTPTSRNAAAADASGKRRGNIFPEQTGQEEEEWKEKKRSSGMDCGKKHSGRINNGNRGHMAEVTSGLGGRACSRDTPCGPLRPQLCPSWPGGNLSQVCTLVLLSRQQNGEVRNIRRHSKSPVT